MKRHAPRPPHFLMLIIGFLLGIGFLVVFSIQFYRPTEISSRAMDTSSFRQLLSQKGITLPDPLPESMSDTQYAQLAQFAGISVNDAKELFLTLKAEENGPSATSSAETVTKDSMTVAPSVLSSIKLGILGDSASDEYRANDNRGGSYGSVTFNWDELLTKYKGINLGPWGTWGGARRSGYENNYAHSGAVAGTMISEGQHTGMASLISAGKVNVVFMMIGNNDFALYSNSSSHPGLDICSHDMSDSQLTSKINTFVGNVTTAVNTIKSAGSAKIIVSSVGDPTLSPHWSSSCADTARLQGAISSVNSRIQSIPGITYYDINAFGQSLISKFHNGVVTIGGVDLDIVNGGDEPHHGSLSDNIHTGTVLSGMIANSILSKVNAVSGTSISPFTESEMLSHAGIGGTSTPPPTGGPTPTPVGVPKKPAQTSPRTNTLFQTSSVSLVWKAVSAPSANYYHVQVSTNPAKTFEDGVVDENNSIAGSSLSYTTKNLPRGSIYYWRVRAGNSTKAFGPWSAVWIFKIAPSVVTLTAPSNGAIAHSVTPTFDWSDSSGANNYYIQFSYKPTMASAFYPAKTGDVSTYTPTRVFAQGKTIYWRVYALSPAGRGDWSDVRSFITPVVPTAPVPRTPTNGTTIIGLIPTVTWKTSTPKPAVSYDVELSTINGTAFDTGIIQTRKNQTGVTTTFSAVDPGKTYYWRVKAYNSMGAYSISAIWSLKTRPLVTVRLTNIKYGTVPNTGVDGFSFDALDEDGVITDDTSSRFAYYFGTGYPHWNRIHNGGTWNNYYGGSSNLTRSAGDYVEFQTTATKLKMYTRKSNSFGKVTVYVNTTKKTTINLHLTSGDVMGWVTIPL